MSIADNVRILQDRIRQAAERANRSPDNVRLVAVSKTFSPAAVQQAVAAGIRHVGENWIQEAEPKIRELAGMDVRPVWHLVGHLQTNKVKPALELFDIIESVDSTHLAEALSRRATKPVGILLEVNVAGEESKYGFAPDEVAAAVEAIAKLPNVDMHGLMTVAPIADDPEDVRPVFRELRELSEAIGLKELSMGMTDDFEVAIEEGATMIRIGRAIFGERPMMEGR